MMFLMAIGVSTMAAAAANAGYIIRQNDFNKIRLLQDSVHESIMFSLQNDPEEMNSLAYQLAMAIFNANDPDNPSYNPNGLEDITFGTYTETGSDSFRISIDGVPIENLGGRVNVVGIKFTFHEQHIIIRDAVDYILQDPPGATGDGIITWEQDREPRTAIINAGMEVELAIRSGGAQGRVITTVSLYEFTGGRLTDDPDGLYDKGVPPGENPSMEFERPLDPLDPNDIGGYGEWRLVRYEIIDR
jgi:hypothetical protein